MAVSLLVEFGSWSLLMDILASHSLKSCNCDGVIVPDLPSKVMEFVPEFDLVGPYPKI